jgi:hypothetical protein
MAAALKTTAQSIKDQLTILTASIRNSFNNMNTRGSSSGTAANDINTQSTIDTLNEKAETTDRQFEEAMYKFQASGGKTRKQTLQEFVILFFFVAYALFTVSLVLYGKTVAISTILLLVIMSIVLLLISGLIIRYS